MKQRTLYSLNEQFERFQAELLEKYETADDVPESALERLQSMQGDVKDKMQQCWYAIKNAEQDVERLKGLAKPFEDEAKRYKTMIKSRQNDIERIKYLVGKVLAGKDVSFDEGAFKWRKNGSDRVTVEDLAAVPMAYCTTQKVPDLAEIKACLKAGEEIPGVKRTVRDTLQVK